jgi:hypothetical protein
MIGNKNICLFAYMQIISPQAGEPYFFLLMITLFSSPRFLCRPTAFFSTCWSRGTSESSTYGKQRICRCNYDIYVLLYIWQHLCHDD